MRSPPAAGLKGAVAGVVTGVVTGAVSGVATGVLGVITGLALLTIAPDSLGEDDLTLETANPLELAAAESLREALGELLAVLSDVSMSPEDRLSAVEKIVRRRLDYTQFSRFALARSKSQFADEQLERYECEFDAYLSNYIGSRLVRYHQEQINVFRATALPNGDVILSTRIAGGDYDQAVVTFLMRKSDVIRQVVQEVVKETDTGMDAPSSPESDTPAGPAIHQWRTIDVAFEGTKVRKLLRAQFQSVLKKGGPDLLISMLQEKTPGESLCAVPDSDETGALDPLDAGPGFDTERFPDQDQPRQ